MSSHSVLIPTIEQIKQLRKIFFEKLEKDGQPKPGIYTIC